MPAREWLDASAARAARDQAQLRLPRTAGLVDAYLLESCGSTNNVARDDLAALLDQQGAVTQDLLSHLHFIGNESNLDTTSEGVPLGEPLLLRAVIADRQTQGRGRLGRVWESGEATSLTGSFVVRLPESVVRGPRAGWITLAAGVAVMNALCIAAGPGSEAWDGLALKWPNDVYCCGKKVSGILAEVVGATADHVDVVAGIGVNLLVPADRLPTPQSTSLQLHASGLPDFDRLRDQVCADICMGLRRWMDVLVSDDDEGFAELKRRAHERSWTEGRRVRCSLAAGRVVEGVAGAVRDDASLPVTRDDGSVVVVTSGDVGVL